MWKSRQSRQSPLEFWRNDQIVSVSQCTNLSRNLKSVRSATLPHQCSHTRWPCVYYSIGDAPLGKTHHSHTQAKRDTEQDPWKEGSGRREWPDDRQIHECAPFCVQALPGSETHFHNRSVHLRWLRSFLPLCICPQNQESKTSRSRTTRRALNLPRCGCEVASVGAASKEEKKDAWLALKAKVRDK